MASGKGFTGFESGSSGDASGGTIVSNSAIGRSGPRYLSVPMIGGYVIVPAGAMTVSVLAQGGNAGFICRMFIKNTGIGGTGTTQGILDVGNNQVRINTLGQVMVGDATRGFVNAGTIANDGAWHEVVIINDQHVVTMPGAASPSAGSILGHACTLTVYNFIGAGSQSSSCIAVSIDGGAFIGHGQEDTSAGRVQTDIMIGNSGGAGGTGQFLVDDVMWAWNDSAVPTLPTNKGVYPVAITSLTAQTNFTGSLSDVSAFPKAPTSALPPYYPTALQSTAANASVTFTHQSHFTLVLGTVEAVKAVIFARRSSGGAATFNVKIGASVAASVAAGSIPQTNTGDEWRPTAYDYTGWTQSAFDALTFGVTQTNAGTLEIGAAMLEVIAAAYAPVTPDIVSLVPTSGPTTGGTLVTITGTFNPTTLILMDQYGTKLISISETTLVIQTPAHPAGTVDVVAVTPISGSATLFDTLASAFTFISPPTPGLITLDAARRDPAIQVTNQLGNGQNSFGFSINGDDAADFEAGATIDMQLGTGDTISRGVLLQTTRTVEDSRFNERVDCSGNDNVWVVNSKLVKGDWTNVSASTIATTIINSFAPNFSSAKVQTGLPAITINFFLDANVGQALDRIVELLPNGHWYLDTDDVIHLFNGTESGIAAPDALTDSNMDLRLAEFPIQIKTDISQIRNKVYVRGSGNPKSTGYLPPVGQPQGDPGGADPWVWTINGSWMALQETGGNIDTNRNTPGLTWYWSASYIFVWTTATGRSFATWTSRWPCPVPLTNPYSVGYITGSNQVGLSVIYATGLDSRITGLEIYREIQRAGPHALNATAYGNTDLFSPNQDSGHGPFFLIKTFTRAEIMAFTTTPVRYLDTASEDTLVGGSMKKYSELVGIDGGSANIFTFAEDTTSQANLAALLGYGDGVREYLINDPTIKTQAQALARAQAELALWANPIIEITYATTDTKTKVGSTVHVDLTDPDITGDFKIQQVRLQHIHENNDTLPVVVATASSVRFTLNDLFAHVVLDSDNSSGGSGGSSASDPASPPSGAAATALQLDPGKKINNTLFTGASDINITAAPDHLGETPAGTINGANTVFTTAATYKTGSLTVYVNGVRQKKTTHWTETSGTTFTMNQAPTTGDLVTVDYEAN
jgi:hypothetical protein